MKISVDPFILNDQDKNFRRIELCEFFLKLVILKMVIKYTTQ